MRTYAASSPSGLPGPEQLCASSGPLSSACPSFFHFHFSTPPLFFRASGFQRAPSSLQTTADWARRDPHWESVTVSSGDQRAFWPTRRAGPVEPVEPSNQRHSEAWLGLVSVRKVWFPPKPCGAAGNGLTCDACLSGSSAQHYRRNPARFAAFSCQPGPSCLHRCAGPEVDVVFKSME